MEKGEEGGKGDENKSQQGREALAAFVEQRTGPCQDAVTAPARLLEAAALICILVTFMQPHNGSRAPALK